MKKFTLLFLFFSKYLIVISLFISVALSLFFVTFNNTATPPCMNADEASFGYNAYSILMTGGDEYGTKLPLRLKSFGDYKLPLYSYLSIPFVGIFGLNEFSIKFLNIIIAGLFPIVIYLLCKELFGKKEIAALAALLLSVSLGIASIERQAHEAALAAFLITLASYFFIKFLNKEKLQYGILFVSAILLSLFTYQSSRIYALFFFLFSLIYFFSRRKFTKVRSLFLSIFIIAVLLFAVTDVINKPARVATLFLTSSPGFSLKIDELMSEGGSRVFYNKLAVGAHDVFLNEMKYFSPQFLAIDGDKNYRFGFPGMSPMTPVEYLFIFVGFYFMFKKKEKWRYFLLSLILVAPFSAALSWAEMSLTRTLFILIPAIIMSAYGMYNAFLLVHKKPLFPYFILLVMLSEAIFLYYSWDFYLNHYSKRAIVVRSWQCGYKELASYVQSNYNKFNTFYITKKNGEPYIFLLFYLKYPPQKYQQQALLTKPDEYGFGQVEKFDKFLFSVDSDAFDKEKVAIIGFPDDFKDRKDINESNIKKN